jgi:dienelactone hydrolase
LLRAREYLFERLFGEMPQFDILGITLTMQHCDLLAGFDSFRFAGSGPTEFCIYTTGQGPAVLLLHELPGMTPSCIGFAQDIAAAGFTVFLPLLFGRPGQNLGELSVITLCVRREFTLLAAGTRGPLTDWLRELCAHVHALRGGPGIGLIGMCLTGGMVFALCASPAVLAAVTSQPSLPISLFRGAKYRSDLGTAPDDLDAAKTRVAANGIDILAFRYSSDYGCPAERFERAKREFGEHFKPTTYPTPDRKHRLPFWSHSVLTETYRRDQPESHPAHRARRAVIAYLRERLLGECVRAD